jgi:antitoxin component YwqK of YwqJK toxin-antitoxin module
MEEGAFTDDRQSGKWKYYSGPGTVVEERAYKDGKLHGKARQFGEDGGLISTCGYKENKLHGKFISYRKGIAVKEITYENGKKIADGTLDKK